MVRLIVDATAAFVAASTSPTAALGDLKVPI